MTIVLIDVTMDQQRGTHRHPDHLHAIKPQYAEQRHSDIWFKNNISNNADDKNAIFNGNNHESAPQCEP